MNLAAQATPLIAALERLGPHDHLVHIGAPRSLRSLFHSCRSADRGKMHLLAMIHAAMFAKPWSPKELT
jgi:hypothetical protein